jgi:hypothetical protein
MRNGKSARVYTSGQQYGSMSPSFNVPVERDFASLRLMIQFVLASAGAILINKSTEGGKFDWVKPYLRESWFAIAVIYTMIALWQERGVAVAMKLKISPTSGGYIVAACSGALLLSAYWWAIGWTLGSTTASASGAPSASLQQVVNQQEEPKKQAAAPIEQKSSGPNSPNIVGNGNTVVVGSPKIEAKLDGIRRLLEMQQGEGAKPDKLLARYPLGYVIFEADYENMVFPYKSQKILDRWDFDWSNVKLTDTGGNKATITMPTIRDKGGAVTFVGDMVTGEKKLGPFPPNVGLFTDGVIDMKAEILAMEDRGIVFLVGFTSHAAPTKH